MNKLGILSAILLGILLYVLGGSFGLFFVAAMVWFLILSATVTVVGKGRKKGLGVYQSARGWKNVVANGIIPLAVVIAFFLDAQMHFISPVVLVVCFVASIAALAADKFASEIGVLSRQRPIMLVTMKVTKAGKSGGVSALGICAGLVGSLLVSLTLINFANFPLYMAIVVLAGLFGNLVDSFFGYFEEMGYGSKYTSNLLGALFGLLLCLAIIIYI